MKILYFGFYDATYSRNRVIIDGLRKNGVEVVECSERHASFFRYLKLIFRYLKLKKDYDIMFVGFPGQEVMFLARLITFRPIVFDVFTSHYMGYILDRKYFSKTGIRAKFYSFLDRWSCKLADMVILDTQAHIDFFVKQFSLDHNLFRRIYVGTDPKLFFPIKGNIRTDGFIVHFHGNYIPLQGVSYIIRAANLLEREDVTFNIVGRGQEYESCFSLAKELGLNNIRFVDKVPYEGLNARINLAHISLGIFGDTPKTNVVIPNKVFEALASGKPLITAETKAIKEFLTDRKDVILCKSGDPEDLACKIMEFKNNEVLRDGIGREGYNTFINNATPEILGKQLLDYIHGKFYFRN